LPPAGNMGVDAIRFYMMEEGMNFVGYVKVSGNVPCIKCGYGDECKMSAVKMIFGPNATVDSVGINRFEGQPVATNAAMELGKEIAQALRIKG
ncbi:MAG TPA: flavodoxin family protein, partial [Candidatus Tripitaka californicus]